MRSHRELTASSWETGLLIPSQAGYNTILCFIGTSGPRISEQRVAMRVSQGGHDVPAKKLKERFPRTLANLKAALRELPNAWVFDHNDLRTPYCLAATAQDGRVVRLQRPVPRWLAPLLPKTRSTAGLH